MRAESAMNKLFTQVGNQRSAESSVSLGNALDEWMRNAEWTARGAPTRAHKAHDVLGCSLGLEGLGVLGVNWCCLDLVG